jgi:F-type H+-transporting ATPase subunit epsilon
MAQKQLQFDVVTLERVVYSKNADVISVPTKEGEISILPNHDALVTLVVPGEIRITNGSERISLAVKQGFLEVKNNIVTILADQVEQPWDINIAEAERAREEALAVITHHAKDDLSFEEALTGLEHARARLKVAKKK